MDGPMDRLTDKASSRVLRVRDLKTYNDINRGVDVNVDPNGQTDGQSLFKSFACPRLENIQ